MLAALMRCAPGAVAGAHVIGMTGCASTQASAYFSGVLDAQAGDREDRWSVEVQARGGKLTVQSLEYADTPVVPGDRI